MKVSTEEFWQLMCNPSFVRVDMHTGRVGALFVEVETPPEAIPGFMRQKIEEAVGWLEPPKRHHRLIWWLIFVFAALALFGLVSWWLL